MDKKKVRLYIILLVLLLCGVILLPFGINYVTDAAVGAILKHSQIEDESETEYEMEFETESETKEPPFEDMGETSCEETDLCETYNDSQKETEEETSEPKESTTDVTSSGINSSRPRSSTISSGSDQGSSEARSEEEEEEQIKQYADMENYAASFSPELIVYEDAKDCYEDFMAGGEENFLHALGEYFYSLYGTSVTIDKIELLEPIYNNNDECSIRTRASALEETETFITRYDKGFDYYGVYAS